METIRCIARQSRAALLIDPAPLRRKALVRLLAQTQGAPEIKGVASLESCLPDGESLVLVALERGAIHSGAAEAQLEAIRARLPSAPVAAYGDFGDDFCERALMLAGFDGAISLDIEARLLEAAIEVLSVGGSFYEKLACMTHRTERRLKTGRMNPAFATGVSRRQRDVRMSMVGG